MTRAKIFSYVTFIYTFFLLGGIAMAMGTRMYAPPSPKHAGLYVPWECSLVSDHAPPLPEEADKLFKEARALEKSGKLSSGEEEQVFELYTKAANMGHWKAMNNLMACYAYGKGTEIDYEAMARLEDQLIQMQVGYGYFSRYVRLDKGWGIQQNSFEADKYLHLAADYGVPDAQYKLGMFYIYPERRDVQGLKYLVCAARQGHAEAMYQIGVYLDIFDNPVMGMEYFYRSAALGRKESALKISQIFHPITQPDNYDSNHGFRSDETISNVFDKYFELQQKHPGTRIPDIFKKYPLPENVLMTREQSRAMPSPLKDAFGGRWPDEIFPELAPDYLPPK